MGWVQHQETPAEYGVGGGDVRAVIIQCSAPPSGSSWCRSPFASQTPPLHCWGLERGGHMGWRQERRQHGAIRIRITPLVASFLAEWPMSPPACSRPGTNPSTTSFTSSGACTQTKRCGWVRSENQAAFGGRTRFTSTRLAHVVVKDFAVRFAHPRRTVSRPAVITLDINSLTAPASQACCKPNAIGAVILQCSAPPSGSSWCRSPFALQTSPHHYWSLERERQGVMSGMALAWRHPHSDGATGGVVLG